MDDNRPTRADHPRLSVQSPSYQHVHGSGIQDIQVQEKYQPGIFVVPQALALVVRQVWEIHDAKGSFEKRARGRRTREIQDDKASGCDALAFSSLGDGDGKSQS